MRVLITNRQEGKTTSLMEWVEQGIRTDTYPYWSRVAIVYDRQQHDWVKRNYWVRIEDFDHRVYTMDEINNGCFKNNNKTIYRFDDLDAVLRYCFPNLNIDGFTITAEPWNQTVTNKTKEIQS